MPRTKRKDKSRVVLRTGESQRADGTYHFSWTDANHKRRYVYAKTLDELRYKEEQIAKDKSDGIKAEARYTTVNDIYELWKDLKRGLKNNTFENYKYMYETFVRHQIGSKTVSSLRKTDIKRFYNLLLRSISKIKRQINPRLKIDGILLTMVDNRTNFAKEIAALLRDTYGSKIKIFGTEIPHSVRAKEISAEGKSIFAHDPGGKVAEGYRNLTKEVLKLEKQREKNRAGLGR